MNRTIDVRLAVSLAGVLLLAAVSLGAPHTDGSYRAGIGLLNKGLNDLAEPEFRAYLRDHPDGAEATNARYALSVCLVGLGRHDEAARELIHVISVQGFAFAADALMLRAQCCVAADDDAGAVESLQSFARDHPDSEQCDHATVMLGECLFRLGQTEAARSTVAVVPDRWPKSPLIDRADLLYAMAEEALGHSGRAAERAARLRERSPAGDYAPHAALIQARHLHQQGEARAAVDLYEAASKGSPDIRAEALLGLASACRSINDLRGAEQAIEAAYALNLAPTNGVQQRLELERGRLLAALGRHGEAARLFEAAAAREPRSSLAPELLFERALLFSEAGDDKAALDAWSEWRSSFGSHALAPAALAAEAWCLHRLGRHRESQQLCQSLKNVPSDDAAAVSIRLLKAENEFAAEHFDDSLGSYEQVLKHDPESAHAPRAALRRVICLARLERDEEAERALRPLLTAESEADSALIRAAITALANAALLKQDWVKGEEWFARLADAQPTREELLQAHLRLGICIQRQGRVKDAIEHFDRVIEAAPGSPAAVQSQFERGQSLLQLGRLDEARIAFEEVVAKPGGDATITHHAVRHLASIASRQGRPADAAALLSELSDSQGATSARLDLAAAWLATGRFAEAEAALASFLDANPKDERSLDARVRLGIAINRQGRHADALNALPPDAALKALSADLRATAHYERALALRALGRDQEAMAAYRLVVAETGLRLAPYAALDLSRLEHRAGNDEESLRLAAMCLESAGSLDTAEASLLAEQARFTRVASLSRLARHAEAADEARALLSAAPSSEVTASIRVLLGESLLSLGQAPAAADEFESAIAAGLPEESRAAAHLRLIEAASASQQWKRSEAACDKFLRLFAESEHWFQARFGQGWACENQGRYDEAIEAYRDVAARHQGPTAARAQFQIGECLFAQKLHEQAVAEFLKTDLLFSYPEWSAAALYEAGRCFAELGRRADAIKQFDEVAKRFPDTEWARLAAQQNRNAAPAEIPGRSKSTL